MWSKEKASLCQLFFNMGLGGHLMWTAVADALAKEKGVPILPIENGEICKSLIFQNNDRFVFNESKQHVKVNISHDIFNYLTDFGYKTVFNTRDHVISHICRQLELKTYELQCHIFFTQREIESTQKVLKNLPNEYIVIEPFSKMSWMQSREYSFKKWQNVVNSLKEYQFVQVGAPDGEKLDNVIYLNGQFSFRETGKIIKHSKLFVSTEGGLGHLSNAVDTQSVLLYTSYQHPTMTAYPTTHVVDISLYRNKILGYKSHKLYKDEVDKHDESEIIELIRDLV